MKYVSTSALAREMEVDPKDLFAKLKNNGWIYKKDDQWHLTKNGRIAGGNIEYNPKFGEYVVWPLNIDLSNPFNVHNLINATRIADSIGISSKKVNLYLSDLGWIKKDRGGWLLTPAGGRFYGHQLEAQNGAPYCVWEESILTNHHFKRIVEIGEGTYTPDPENQDESEELDDFRKKYPAEKRTSDGHYVRSRAELLIDNFFYQHGIVHAYEKKVNIDEPLYCDFYLPSEKIYVEFWGMEENEQYLERKKRKLELYSNYGFSLIELRDSDLENLDEVLETKLRRYNIVV